METKVCTKCKIEKSISEYSFKRPKNRKPGYQSRCKSCCIEDVKLWRTTQSSERLKDLYYMRTYRLSLQDFNSMLNNQQGRCLLCQKPLNMTHLSADRAVVDHCHTKGHVRGILCNECNRGLGYFKDNIMTLQRAVQYLIGEDLTSKGGQ